MLIILPVNSYQKMNLVGHRSVQKEQNMKSKKEAGPRLDTDRIDNAVLALLYLNLHHCGVAWKGFDWDAMNRIFERGLISDPVRKAKSVGFSDEGESYAKKLFEQMFVVKEN
jgi:hypothetical protein